MAPFDYNYQNPSHFLFLVLIDDDLTITLGGHRAGLSCAN